MACPGQRFFPFGHFRWTPEFGYFRCLLPRPYRMDLFPEAEARQSSAALPYSILFCPTRARYSLDHQLDFAAHNSNRHETIFEGPLFPALGVRPFLGRGLRWHFWAYEVPLLPWCWHLKPVLCSPLVPVLLLFFVDTVDHPSLLRIKSLRTFVKHLRMLLNKNPKDLHNKP